jgi:acylphosphatase
MESHKMIVVKGRVQGVWFRKYAQDKADDLGLSGFVKNEPDGTVYIEVSGEKDHVDVFVQWCHSGPPLAHVESVDVKENNSRHIGSFAIR